jgi:tetratricopeptide (TPR) repeat protein
MAYDVKVFGALLTSFDGLSIAGDLGIDKDVDIVCGMLTVVGRFVQDTWGEDAEQIHLKDTVVSRLNGKFSQLILTSSGTSEALIDSAKKLLNDLENQFGEKLKDWDGTVVEGLEDSFLMQLESLRRNTGVSENLDIPVPGFDILKRDDVLEHLDDIEDAINGYHLLAERETALDLARKAIVIFEEKDPDTRDSSLFHALAAKMVAELRDVERSGETVEIALEKSRAQQNKVAQAESTYVKALQHLFNNEPEQALEMYKEAVERIKEAGVDRPRNFLRMIKYGITEPWAYDLMGKYDTSIRKWKGLLALAENSPEGGTDMEKAMLRKHKINLNNNLGYTTISQDMMDSSNYEEAIEYYRKSFDIVEKTDARYCSPLVKLNLAQAYCFTKNWDEVERLLEEALEESKSQKNEYRILCVERVYGVYHLLKGIENKDSDELFDAIFHFKKALENQTEKPEIETLKFFIKETENALKQVL